MAHGAILNPRVRFRPQIIASRTHDTAPGNSGIDRRQQTTTLADRAQKRLKTAAEASFRAELTLLLLRRDSSPFEPVRTVDAGMFLQ
jgi:hypothetical protein